MVAKRDGFCRPMFNQNDRQILVRDGRNIIVEQVSILINFLFFNTGGGDKSLSVKCFGKVKIFWNKITNLPRWDAFEREIFSKNICQGKKNLSRNNINLICPTVVVKENSFTYSLKAETIKLEYFSMLTNLIYSVKARASQKVIIFCQSLFKSMILQHPIFPLFD
jgi:hypothetical protein